MEPVINGDLVGIAMGTMCPVCVIEARRTARRRVRPRASNDCIVRPINVISAAVRVRRGMRPVNVSIASAVRTPGGR
mgnify:CR=1 FL=1